MGERSQGGACGGGRGRGSGGSGGPHTQPTGGPRLQPAPALAGAFRSMYAGGERTSKRVTDSHLVQRWQKRMAPTSGSSSWLSSRVRGGSRAKLCAGRTYRAWRCSGQALPRRCTRFSWCSFSGCVQPATWQRGGGPEAPVSPGGRPGDIRRWGGPGWEALRSVPRKEGAVRPPPNRPHARARGTHPALEVHKGHGALVTHRRRGGAGELKTGESGRFCALPSRSRFWTDRNGGQKAVVTRKRLPERAYRVLLRGLPV